MRGGRRLHFPGSGRIQLLVGLTLAALIASAIAVRLASPAVPAVGPGMRAALACGVERWAVKTLTDPQARLVNFHPRAITVSALRRLRPTGFYSRGPGVERRTYRIRVRLVETKLELDEDYHLVVADLRHPS